MLDYPVILQFLSFGAYLIIDNILFISFVDFEAIWDADWFLIMTPSHNVCNHSIGKCKFCTGNQKYFLQGKPETMDNLNNLKALIGSN